MIYYAGQWTRTSKVYLSNQISGQTSFVGIYLFDLSFYSGAHLKYTVQEVRQITIIHRHLYVNLAEIRVKNSTERQTPNDICLPVF